MEYQASFEKRIPDDDQRYRVAEGSPSPAASGGQNLFDGYAENYDDALNQGIGVSGEDKSYFARKRIAWLSGCLRKLRARPRLMLDFGCGTGSAVPFFMEILQPERLLGVDASPASISRAKESHGSEQISFFLVNSDPLQEQVDLAFCNGVFHHIPPNERAAAVSYVFSSLRPGGLFAFWENNPWNPGTRHVMSRIPFDRDAITLSPAEAKRLLSVGGFQIVRTDFLFIFPRVLRWFRFTEPLVSKLPLGAQYQILCRKA
jgi:SAM-dependent methyltransferase